MFEVIKNVFGHFQGVESYVIYMGSRFRPIVVSGEGCLLVGSTSSLGLGPYDVILERRYD